LYTGNEIYSRLPVVFVLQCSQNIVISLHLYRSSSLFHKKIKAIVLHLTKKE